MTIDPGRLRADHRESGTATPPVRSRTPTEPPFDTRPDSNTPLIRATDSLHDVLARHPMSIDVLLQHSVCFAALRRPAPDRKALCDMTVAEAARFAGLPAPALIESLNAVLDDGQTAAGFAAPASPIPAPYPTDRRVVDLDIRHELRTRRKSLRRAMFAAEVLGRDEVLRLRVIAEPLGWYPAIERRGFAHAAHRHEAGDWSVWLWRP